jgi:hypothetical protein
MIYDTEELRISNVKGKLDGAKLGTNLDTLCEPT